MKKMYSKQQKSSSVRSHISLTQKVWQILLISLLTYQATAKTVTEQKGNTLFQTSCNSIHLGGRLEAENWCEQSGFQTEATTDPNGGNLNIGWTDTGDWLEYQIFVETAGTREISFRVAAEGTATKSFQLLSDGDVLTTVAFQGTGGWQNWVTITKTVHIKSGGQRFRLEALSDGFNLNYMDFKNAPFIPVTGVTLAPLTENLVLGGQMQLTATVTPNNATNKNLIWTTAEAEVATVDQNGLVTAGTKAYLTTITVTTEDGQFSDQVVVAVNTPPCLGQTIPGRIESEDFSDQEGIIAAETSIGWLDAGDWIEYLVNVQETGTYDITFRTASEYLQENNLQFSLDGEMISSTVSTPNTGGWVNYTDVVLANVALEKGCSQSLRLQVLSGATNIDYMDFTLQVTEPPVATSMVISPQTATIALGETQTFSVTRFDQFGNTMADTVFSWYMGGDCGTCGNGETTTTTIFGNSIHSIGTHKITASYKGFSLMAEAFVTIVDTVKERQLVWSDEFNYTGLPDPSKWGYDTGNGGFGNNELQNYTENRLENARVENGVLVIEARKDFYQNIEYSSARMVTRNKGDWKYGRIDVRAKLPGGRGTWPAIWMLPTDWEYGGWPKSGEIDIMENVGYDPNNVHGTVHTEAYNHRLNTQLAGTVTRTDYQSDFHVYSVEWTEEKIDFILDDQVYFTFNQHGGSAEWPFDKRFHLILNIAVGGDWGGAQGVDPNIWPRRMEVDYVRVYEKLPVTPQGSTIRIEAESFDSMEGVEVENCEEGGQNLGWIDAGDWISFDNINIPATGSYIVSYRVASENNTGSFNLEGNAGATHYGNIDVSQSNSSGWQDWKTVSHIVNLTAGSQNFGIGVTTGGFNLNWLEISPTESSKLVKNLPNEFAAQETTLQVYPNPAVHQITISGFSEQTHRISITGIDGKVYQQTSIAQQEKVELSIKDLDPGIYFVQIANQDKVTIHKVMKQ